MKLRNKKTGQVINYYDGLLGDRAVGGYESLAELNEEWEDYEETNYYIDCLGEVLEEGKSYCSDITPEKLKEIGNYFETKEEAEKVVEKLKAWKRLKNFGFNFIGKDYRGDKHFGSAFFQVGQNKNIRDFYQDNQDFYDDLNLLFGGN